ncbi:MAG: single-stranded DNA-binding protein [Verrucomicrobiota bacterium]|jgi:single-strand DNA-binding protein|nr:single-stranded DNA-binding protein [Verrucomicrobiota bacterium]MED5470815.1 single-stranded DNA-binding protein [Verrucomicrobiota bacterium]MEE2967958.1 single-stranded DNA-binding protein [Verrucomicrobiota bacterium]
MASVNKVILIGNCTRDPEVRYTPKGTAVADIGMAMNRYFSSDGGERREETTFVDVTLWGRQAEVAGEYLKKGRPVYIEGRLQMDSWDDKNTGQKRTKLKIVGEQMQLLGSREGGGGSGPQQRSESPQSNQSSSESSGGNDGAQFETDAEDDDIPF